MWQALPEPEPPLSVLTFISMSNCCETPKSGTIPIVELLPLMKLFIALAVDERLPSSQNDTILATPICLLAWLWQPVAPVSRNYSLAITLMESREVNGVYNFTGSSLPLLSYMVGTMSTSPKPAIVLPVPELQNTFPEMKYLQLRLMNAPTFSQIRYRETVLQQQQTLRPAQAGRLWATDPYNQPVAPRYMRTRQRPSIGEVWLNANPALKELNGPTLVLVALYSPRFKGVSQASTFSVDMPHRRYTLLAPRSRMGMLLTCSAVGRYLFSLTTPEKKSKQYALRPRMLEQRGLLICVRMRIGCEAVIELTEKVMVDRSSEISQELKIAAGPVAGVTDWHSPMKLKSRRVVPEAVCWTLELSQWILMVKLAPVLRLIVGVTSMSMVQMDATRLAYKLEVDVAIAMVPAVISALSMQMQRNAQLESYTIGLLRSEEMASSCTSPKKGSPTPATAGTTLGYS